MSRSLTTEDLAMLRDQLETVQRAIDARGPGVADDGPHVLLTSTKAAGEMLLEEVGRLRADLDGLTVGEAGDWEPEAGDIPDLTDDATAGVLLGMLRERVGLCAVQWDADEASVSHWSGHIYREQETQGATLGEAVARALLHALGPADG